jgi:hypothetical protein
LSRAGSASSGWPIASYAVVSGQPPLPTLAAVEAAATAWGAVWEPSDEGGLLYLPVVAGLRRGVLRLRVQPAPAASPATLELVVEEARLHLHTGGIVVLVFALVGCLATLAWPFLPAALALAPTGLLLALGGWFLVVSKLGNSGPDEFIGTVLEKLAAPDEPAAAE